MEREAGNTKLDRLNMLLERDATKLGLPQFRSKVSMSGANQDWLRKALKRHPEADPEIKHLLDLKFKDLLSAYHHL